MQHQSLHLAKAQTRVSVPHALSRLAAFFRIRQDQCGTDTLVCAGDARVLEKINMCSASYSKNGIAAFSGDASSAISTATPSSPFHSEFGRCAVAAATDAA